MWKFEKFCATHILRENDFNGINWFHEKIRGRKMLAIPHCVLPSFDKATVPYPQCGKMRIFPQKKNDFVKSICFQWEQISTLCYYSYYLHKLISRNFFKKLVNFRKFHTVQLQACSIKKLCNVDKICKIVEGPPKGLIESLIMHTSKWRD